MRVARLLPLSDACDVEQVGGKAARLSRMLGDGFPVPPGFVVPQEALQAFLDETSLSSEIDRLRNDLTDGTKVREVSTVIRDLFLGSPLPLALREELSRFWEEHLERRDVIVRSSGIGEDGSESSYAGLLDSFPSVATTEKLEQTLKACWASAWSERSLAYQLARGVRLRGVGVIVQLQIDASISGVLFTRAPSASEELLGEYVYGAGESLVSGRADPGRFSLKRQDLRCLRMTKPPDTDHDAPFTENQLRELGRFGLELERRFGDPQDIEWTLDSEGRLYLVQSRPITVPARNVPGAEHVVWSNANVNENFPGPITPFLYSVASVGYEHYFRNLGIAFGVTNRRIDAADSAFRNIIGVHGARIYYNVTNIHRVLRAVPFGEWLTRSFDDFVGTRPDGAAEETSVEKDSKLRQAVELAWICLKTSWFYVGLDRRVRDFEATVDRFASEWQPDRLGDRSLRELRSALMAFLDIRRFRWLGASLADAAAMVTSGALKSLLGSDDRHATELGELLKGLPDIVSVQPALKLWELSRLVRQDAALEALFRTTESTEIFRALEEEERFVQLRRSLDGYLDRWGFRCPGELMMTVPSFQESPERLLDLLKPYVASDARAPNEALDEAATRRLVATERVRARLGREKLYRFLPLVKRSLLLPRLLSWTHRAIALRERARLKQALLYSRCRRIVLAIGETLVAHDVLKHRDDTFFLTWQELDRFLSGSEMFPARMGEQIAMRKEEHELLGRTEPPAHFVLPVGEYFDVGALEDEATAEDAADPTDPHTLVGIGAGTGKVQGPAAVLDDVTECQRLRGGDVLVARQTDPGWGPVFPLIKGLVLERGGLLSHGAILAREFGIPSVVGVKDATRLITDGRSLEVDGDSGRVHLVE